MNHAIFFEPETSITSTLHKAGIALPMMCMMPGLSAHAAQLLIQAGCGKRLLVVTDERIFPAAAARVCAALEEGFVVQTLLLPTGVTADERIVAQIQQAAAEVDAIIAIGSGTINDLCKYASFRMGKPYVVFASAPSMNGYASANASITVNGHKKTLPAHLPKAIFADLEVLAAAPPRLIAAGMGDSLCRSTAQIDWLLSHHLLGTAYDAQPFAWLAPYEQALLAAPAGHAPTHQTMAELMAMLLLAGLGMSYCQGSYPASQGEHMIAHALEMIAPTQLASYYHGEHIAVTTLTMARVQQVMIARATPPQLQPWQWEEERMNTLYGREVAQEMRAGFAAKIALCGEREHAQARLEALWPTLREQLQALVVPVAALENALSAIHAPLRAHDIGIAPALYEQATRTARFTRERFTFLDLS